MTEPLYKGNATDFYLASESVAKIVNLAVRLKRPILVEGEPGCGKTRLADSIHAEKKFADNVVKINVKSTSRAQDLLYRFNGLKRLQDAQNPNNQRAQWVYPYLSLGPLGEAIHKRKRTVVLIDEIDKADIDFPNDLLDVLDTFSFQIDDLPPEEEQSCIAEKNFGRVVTGSREAPPIVVITSNREKRLPEPFLRRCLYVRVTFPETPAQLQDIVRKNTKLSSSELSDNLLNAAVIAFLKVRQLAVGNTQKPPTTSELIDWVQILHWDGVSEDTLRNASLQPPSWEALFKTMGDLDAYRRLASPKEAQA